MVMWNGLVRVGEYEIRCEEWGKEFKKKIDVFKIVDGSIESGIVKKKNEIVERWKIKWILRFDGEKNKKEVVSEGGWKIGRNWNFKIIEIWKKRMEIFELRNWDVDEMGKIEKLIMVELKIEFFVELNK